MCIKLQEHSFLRLQDRHQPQQNLPNHSLILRKISESIILVIMVTPIDPKQAVLLLLDLQNGFLQRLPPDTSASVVEHAALAISVAREHGVQVTYIRAALDQTEVDAIPDRKPLFLTRCELTSYETSFKHLLLPFVAIY